MHRLRLICNGRPETGLRDQRNSLPVGIWDADDLAIELFLSECSSCVSFDIATVTSVSLEIRAERTDTAALVSKSSTSLSALTYADWKEDEDYHCQFILSNNETNLASDVDTVWLSIVAILTDGSRYTFAAGEVTVAHSGHTGTGETGDIEFTLTDGFASFAAGSASYKFIVTPGGSGSATGTITVVDGLGEITIDGENYQFVVNESGSGSAEGTITIVDGFAEFTSAATNYRFIVTPA